MKANTLVKTDNLSHEDWLAWRSKGIGGSDAAIICGLNKYKSASELWLEKTGQIEVKPAGESAYWGTVLEPVIKAEFTRRTGLEVSPVNAILQHPEHSFILGNVDGVVDDPELGPGIFEAKTANAFLAAAWDDSVPEMYQLQLQHYLAITGLEYAHIAVLLGGNTFKHQIVPRDNQIIELLIQLERHFWSLVESNTPPDIDANSTELLKRLYPDSTKTAIELPDEALDLIQAYETAATKEKEAQARKEDAGNKLKNMLESNEKGTVGDRIVTWKTVNTDRFNTNKFKKEHPELYKQFVSKSSYRRFAIK